MKRIFGFDLARSLAILGMIIVNYKIVMSYRHEESGILTSFVGIFEGRAAALFVVLAGIGISLMLKSSEYSSEEFRQKQISLLKRAAFLFIVGLCYSPIWPADILHFYGVFIAFALIFLSSRNITIITLAVFSTLLFPIMMFFIEYETGWNFETFSYIDFWTLEGMTRHLFFNGFHPVFPWVSFLFFGIYLGRLDWQSENVKLKLFKYSAITFLTVEIFRYIMPGILLTDNSILDEIVQLFFSAKPMPPFPIYILSASASSLLLILLSIYVTEKLGNNLIIKSLATTGKLALTIYVAHVVIGMWILEELDLLNNQPLHLSFTAAIAFYFCSVIFSVFWMKKFKMGPLEIVMRKITG